MLEMDCWISESKSACRASYRHSTSGTKSFLSAEPSDDADLVVLEQEAAAEAVEAVEAVEAAVEALEAAEAAEAFMEAVEVRSPSRGREVGHSWFRGASSFFVSHFPWSSLLGIATEEAEEDGGWYFFAFFALRLSARSSEVLLPSRFRLIWVPGKKSRVRSIRQVRRTAHLCMTLRGCSL